MNGPAPIDDDARARVLRRALELSDVSGTQHPQDQLEVLRSVAAELGIPAGALDRALAEERAGLLTTVDRPARRAKGPRRSLADVVAGPAEVEVSRVLPQPSDPLVELDVWFRKVHVLRRRMLADSTGVWERRTDAGAVMKRSVTVWTGEGRLGEVPEIRALQHDLGDERLIRVRADLRRSRTGYLAGGATIGASGAAGAVVAGIVLAPVAFVAAPVAVAIGALVAGSYRRRVRVTAQELERVLDQVAYGEVPRGPLGTVAEHFGGRRRAAKMDGP